MVFVPVRVLQDDRIVVVRGAPIRLESVPVRVVGQVPSQVTSEGGHLIGQPLTRRHPVWLPLEHRQVLDLVNTRVDDLYGGAARPDHSHLLAGEIE